MNKQIVVILFLILITVNSVYAATASSIFTLNKNPKKTPPVKESVQITQLRRKYCNRAESLSSSGNHLDACIVYQNLIEELNGFSKNVPVNKWLLSYNGFYREIISNQTREKNIYDSSRMPFLSDFFKAQKQSRKLTLNKIPTLVSRTVLPVKGDLSLDSKQILAVTPSFSPFYASQNVISVFSSIDGKKIYESLPIPDDRNNPQIVRWGWAYSVSRAKWSPDGTKYAYLLNGALCINSVDGKPVLISSVPDSKKISDISFLWSSEGKHLVYIRAEEDAKYVCLNNAIGSDETKIGKGSYAALSLDGNLVVLGQGENFRLYNVSKKKDVYSFNGSDPVFSTDGQKIAFIRGQSLYTKNISDASESMVAKLPSDVVTFAPLCKNIYGVSLKTEELLLVSSESSRNLGKTNGNILTDTLQSPYRVVCEKEIIMLK